RRRQARAPPRARPRPRRRRLDGRLDRAAGRGPPAHARSLPRPPLQLVAARSLHAVAGPELADVRPRGGNARAVAADLAVGVHTAFLRGTGLVLRRARTRSEERRVGKSWEVLGWECGRMEDGGVCDVGIQW